VVSNKYCNKKRKTIKEKKNDMKQVNCAERMNDDYDKHEWMDDDTPTVKKFRPRNRAR